MAKEEKSKAGGKKEEAAAAPAKKKSRTLLIVVIAVVTALAAGGGGAAWWFARGHGAAAGTGAEKRAERQRPSVYVPLETFTVNLQPENGDRFLQTNLSLSVADGDGEQAIKQLMPVIRSRLLLVLSSKKPSELGSVEGKQHLANQIAAEVNGIVTPGVAASRAPAEGTAKEGKGAPGEGKDAAAEGQAEMPVRAAAEPKGPVLSVLFTNFIIQ